ncbi:MAG: ATP-binding cassette domain-containing protein [Clostridia bacterium]|nr:ATP-binding cassette domain-containing protein [Clostridia bacterium]
MALTVDIRKALGDFRLDMRFTADDGVLALLGASGCGKSMTLRCIAGVERPDRGHIELNGRVLYDSGKRIDLKPQERRVGYLFQQYALFPNMTVRQNILCGVRDRRNGAAAADAMIQSMELTGLESLKPRQLSGGQQQRTALARILVNEPDLMLLDEPFSALDSHLRFQMEREVRRIIRGFKKPVLLVSHSRDEVYRLSDRIAVMGNGHIETVGENHQVFADPVTKRGAVLTGCKNISPARQNPDATVRASDWGLDLKLPRWPSDADCVGIRMHDIRPAMESDTVNVFPCRVEEVVENPFSFTVMLRPEGTNASRAVGWETDKETWRRHQAERLVIHLPPDAVLPLKE